MQLSSAVQKHNLLVLHFGFLRGKENNVLISKLVIRGAGDADLDGARLTVFSVFPVFKLS